MPRLKKTPPVNRTVATDRGPVAFDLSFSARKTLTLRIQAGGAITVDAPLRTRLRDIDSFVQLRAAWIEKHLQAVRERPSNERQYIEGERWFYLGEAYPLHIEADHIERVALRAGVLTVGVRDPVDRERVRALLARWYRRRALEVFNERLKLCGEWVKPLGLDAPPLKIRRMKSRWGSCSSHGAITLNLNLVQASAPLIDYVIVHELCHLREFNHSPPFWALVASVIPDWKARRKALNRSGYGLLP